MTRIPETSASSPASTMRVLGKGSEATVYLDARANRAVKQFDRAPIAIARSKARSEFARLQRAHNLTHSSRSVNVPAPGTLNEPAASFSMGIVHGPSLLTQLLGGSIADELMRTLAAFTAEGFQLFREILSDFTLDHLFPIGNERITFVDFGNGSASEEGLTPEGTRATFIEAAGATLYECTRPARFFNRSGMERCADFLAYVAVELGINWDQALQHAIDARFNERGKGGSATRIAWYAFAGRINRKRFFSRLSQTIELNTLTKGVSVDSASIADSESAEVTSSRAETESIAIADSVATTDSGALTEIISFVWDFPEEDGAFTNGIHKVVDGMMAAMVRQGTSATVLALGSQPSTHTRKGYRVEHLRAGRIPPIQTIRQRIQRAGPGAVTFFHGTFNPRYTLLARALRRHQLPYVVVPHTLMDDGFFSVSRLKKAIYWKAFERKFLDQASCICSYDLGQKKNLASRGVHAPMIESWNGICDPVVPKTDRYSTEGSVRFHFFGRIATGTKGLDMLLDATARVSKTKDIEVIIQGPGTEDLDDLKQCASDLGIAQVVRFEPPASSPNPILIMAEYDVSILSSRYEGFPTALVEAMMAGRPIVTTRVGTLAPVLEREGIAEVVDTTSESIAQGMLNVIKARSQWPEIGLNGRQWAMNHLQWDPIVQRLLADLNACLNRPS